jgi:NADPH:quinone reductase-like Zn-dependent oxidoreductase
MKAIGYAAKGGVEVLTELELPMPEPGPRDLRVAVRAVSVNPVDVKRRRWEDPSEGLHPRVLGYDAAGIVEAVGSEVTLFKPGDEVFYAGAMDRPGTNSEFHLVDERIVGPKPASLSFAEAAALPLTSITAWGNALRPHEGTGWCAQTPRYAACSERSRGRRLHADPVGEPSHEPHRHRNDIPARKCRVGTQARRKARCRPQQAH